MEVFNTTVLRVSWTPVPPATVRGHLGGYKVSGRCSQDLSGEKKSDFKRTVLDSSKTQNKLSCWFVVSWPDSAGGNSYYIAKIAAHF